MISVLLPIRIALLPAGAQSMKLVTPILIAMTGIAGLVSSFFLVTAGVQYITSSGSPEKLMHAKKIIRNALIGLLLVLSAAVITGILSHAFSSTGSVSRQALPNLRPIQTTQSGGGIVGVLVKAVIGLLDSIVNSAAQPFIKALSFFTSGTPMVTGDATVFKLWAFIAGLADGLFVLVIALLGFHVMSYASLGLEEIEFKHLLPQIGIIFFLINSSAFVIDGLIGLSNGLIHTVFLAFDKTTVWDVLTGVAKQANGFGLAALLIMVAFLILSVVLLVYYIDRLVSIYLGAILSPLVLLLWLIPSFRDFSVNAAKTYVMTIFVLFVHVIILELAASLFAGLISNSPYNSTDPIMPLLIGLSTLVVLLKSQGVLTQFSYASMGPRSMRKLGGQFVNSISATSFRG
jgi:hypothetical protein